MELQIGPYLVEPPCNTSTKSLDAVDLLTTTEAHSWPPSDQTATTARLNFSEMRLLDHSTVESRKIIDLPDVEAMISKNIIVLERLLEEVLWLVDIILETRIKDHLWAKYFKNQRHRSAIEGIYGDVRSLVWSLLDRGKAKKPVLSDPKLHIVLVHSESKAPKFGRLATTYPYHHTIVLWPCFKNRWSSWEGSSTHELRENYLRADSLDATHVYRSRAGTLLHELVHYVSHITWDKFRSRLKRYPYVKKQLRRAPPLIIDVDPSKYATKNNKSNDAILQKFRDQGWLYGKDSNGEDKFSCYGLGVTEHLAKLKSGGMVTLLNAEN